MPRAWQTLLTYLSFHIPPASEFRPYDPLQQLAYAAVVFLLGPFMLLTGAAMSPSLEARFPWYVKLFGGKQSARSLHFLSLVAFILFIIVHTALVLIVHFQDNIRNIVFGTPQSNVWLAIFIAIIALVVVAIIYALSTLYSLGHRRQMQHVLGAVVEPVRKKLLIVRTSQQHYNSSAITSYFWVNGRPPEGKEGEEYCGLPAITLKTGNSTYSDWWSSRYNSRWNDLRAMPSNRKSPSITVFKAGRGSRNGLVFLLPIYGMPVNPRQERTISFSPPTSISIWKGKIDRIMKSSI